MSVVRTVPDECPSCGGSLFSGFFDADDLGFPLEVGDPTPEGVRWTTFCNECGDEVLPQKARK